MSNPNSCVLIGDEVDGNVQVDEQLSDIGDDDQDIIDDTSSPLFDQDPKAKSIHIIKTRSYQTNTSDLAYILEELEKFDHFEQIKNEEGYEDLLKQSLDHLHYEHVPKGKFLFHYGDIGEKFYFIAKGRVSIHVPRPSKEIFKQEKNYQLRKYWGDQIDQQSLTANERETAKVHYQRARAKILKYQEKYQHEKFYKKIQSGHPSNQKYFTKYFHQQYKTFGLYKQVNELKDGQSFGEVATISRKLRTASVFAEEDLHLFYMRGKDYLNVFQAQLYKLNFILKNLEKYFENLSKKQILDLSYLFEAFEHTLHLNQIIFKEGQERQYLYLIKTGSVAFKSSRGISLGIISEGEFFGFENKKGTDHGLLNDKHSFSAICVATGTIVFRLKIQLLEEEDFLPALKEFALKGFQKAEYYSKRAKHCQNIFEINDANNPYNQELQNYSDLISPKNSFPQNESPLAKAKNLRRLMNKIQIQKKFNKYLEDSLASKQQQAQSSPNDEREKSNRPSQLGSFGSNLQLNEQYSDQKGSQISINDNLIQSPQPSSSHRLQTSPPVHISNKYNENEIQINSFLTVDQINSLNFNTQFKKPDSASQQKSHQQHQQNTQDVGEINQFHFVSKEEFEQTKNNIIKEQEKLRAKKAQHYVPQEIADMPLSRKISQKYVSSSSLLSGTPQSSTNKQPPPLSSFFNQQLQQPSSPLLKSPASSSPLKNPSSPLKMQSSQPQKDNQQFVFFPTPSQTTQASSATIAANNNQAAIANQNIMVTSINSQLAKRKLMSNSPISKRHSMGNLVQSVQLPSATEPKTSLLYSSQQNLYSRRGSRGSLIISALSIPNKPGEKRNSSTNKQRMSPEQEQLGSMLMPQISTSYLASSPLTLKQKISAFSYSQPPTNMVKSTSSVANTNDKININVHQSPPLSSAKSPQVSSILHSPRDLYHPEIKQSNNDSSSNINYSIPSAYRNQQYQVSDEVLQNSPLIMRPSLKSFLSTSNSNQQDQSNVINGSMNDTLKKFNKTHNQLFDKKIRMSLAVTDLNFPQNSKPSITSITLKSFTEFNSLPTGKQQSSQNQSQSTLQQPASVTHRRSYSQMQHTNSEYQLQKQSAPKNKQYTQLFKKSNESKSLKKKQKIMPLLMNEQDTILTSNGNQQSGNNSTNPASPQQLSSPLCVSASISYTNGFPNIAQRKKIPSLFTHSNQQNASTNPLQSPILKIDKPNQANYPLINYKYQQKLAINGQNPQTQSLNLLSPNLAPQSSRPSIQMQQFCSIKQFLEGNENVNNIKYDIVQSNSQQKNI